MQKTRATLNATDEVVVQLTDWGCVALGKMVAKDCADAVGDAPPSAPPRSRSKVSMPLWELVKLLGPLTPSSLRRPFESIEFDGNPRLKRAVELAAERATESLSLLRMLAEDVGIGDTEYCSPEELVRRVAEFSDAEVPRVPDGSGWWWHGERVVEVEADYEGSPGRMNGPGILVVVRANGRRTPLAEMPDWWGGPARRDARCPVPPSDDEDAIPF